jgi:hypothetical protein
VPWPPSLVPLYYKKVSYWEPRAVKVNLNPVIPCSPREVLDRCSVNEFGRFIDGSKQHAAGWIGFYWGKPPDELRKSRTIPDAMMLG